METTATYDKQTQEFIVNTPTTLAQKYWITNGALHAQHCVVFAQLIIDGQNHGEYNVRFWSLNVLRYVLVKNFSFRLYVQ